MDRFESLIAALRKLIGRPPPLEKHDPVLGPQQAISEYLSRLSGSELDRIREGPPAAATSRRLGRHTLRICTIYSGHYWAGSARRILASPTPFREAQGLIRLQCGKRLILLGYSAQASHRLP
jgi:hypothetical protein